MPVLRICLSSYSCLYLYRVLVLQEFFETLLVAARFLPLQIVLCFVLLDSFLYMSTHLYPTI